MDKILLLGAGGHTGLKVARSLLSRDYRIVVLYYNGKPDLADSSVEFIQGDATKYEDILRALEGVSAVVNCVGFGKGSGKPTDFFSRVNKLLITAMKEKQVLHLVTMSNVGVFKTGNRLVYGFIVPTLMKWLKHIMDDKERMENQLKGEREIKWVAARFPNIIEGPVKPIKSDDDGKSLSLSITTDSVGEVLAGLVAQPDKRHAFPCFSN